jgi:hypothetical protein
VLDGAGTPGRWRRIARRVDRARRDRTAVPALAKLHVFHLAIDVVQPATAYAAMLAGLWRTVDGGVRWTEITGVVKRGRRGIRGRNAGLSRKALAALHDRRPSMPFACHEVPEIA